MSKKCLWTLGLGLLLLEGCATLPSGKADPRDRFERFNRSVYAFNDAVDRAALKPVAKGYKAAIPAPVRHGISNFFSNLSLPRTIINDLLQAKFAAGGRATLRLTVNTVMGLGFFDPATQAGLNNQNEDFGQTLGKWGVPSGPYLMLPLLGPSTVRDGLGRIPDIYDNPEQLITNNYVYYGLVGVDAVDTRSQLLDSDAVLQRSFDPYSFIRNAWLQRREYQVRDGDVPTAKDLEDPDAPPEDPDALDPEKTPQEKTPQ